MTVELLLATLATDADIESLLRTRSWDCMFLTEDMANVGRIELIDSSTAMVSHGFDIKCWEPVDEQRRLFRPVPQNIDCYIDPLSLQATLAEQLATRVFGAKGRHRVAMHMRNEPHIHDMNYWYDAEEPEAFEQLITTCAQNSRDVRDMPEFRTAMSTVQRFEKKQNTWGVV
ncbi:hypothetical protein SynSYN20_01553 [Synechococcus sp. SYN20]|uniref:hypothetical protein n=1 Tax=Synechococcus sp. SYN20 TaxID=1050714 RepID=UPI0016469A62|nr:hypothetical protein [Synechococcus sp. SYN20]QNJ25880.1 hypothetical protein SynSYN20_01553 [Synechococcus sp. SYN20]